MANLKDLSTDELIEKIQYLTKKIEHSDESSDKSDNSDHQFRTLVDTIQDGLVIISKGKIIYSNNSFAEMLGYNKEELTGMSILKPVAQSYKSLVQKRYEARIRGEDVPRYYDVELESKDGKIIPANLSVGMVTFKGEKDELVIIRDISETQKQQKKLDNERHLLQYFMDSIPDSIYFKDEESKFIKVNRATLNKLGFKSNDELIGKTDHDIFLKEHADDTRRDELKLINGEETIINRVEKETWKNRKISWVSTIKVPLKDAEQNIIGTLGITRDITNVKKSEEVQRALYSISKTVTSTINNDELYCEIHNILKSLVKAENLYIALYDEEQDLITFPYFVDVKDDPPEPRKPGKGLTELVLHSGESLLVDEEYDNVLMEKGLTHLVGEPSEIWLGVPLKIHDKTIGVLAVQDYGDKFTYGDEEQKLLSYVSEQIALAINKKRVDEELKKYSEELKESNAAKDKFFSIIAHDLKSPFQGLMGLTDILTEEFDSLNDEDKSRYIKTLKESTEGVYELLDNLLEWSRLQTDRMKFEPESLNAFLLAEKTKGFLEYNASQKGILIHNLIPPAVRIWGDKNMLTSIFHNIISNAVKFTNRGGEIGINYKNDDKHIYFKVVDTGVGIEKNDIPKLFRIDTAFSTRGTKNEKGTGLGLILCKEMIIKHHGEIKIESAPDKGTTVTICLPNIKKND